MKRLLLPVLALMIMGCTFMAPPAGAVFDPLQSVDCNQAAQRESAVCNDKQPSNNPLSGDKGLLINITRIVAFIAGAAAVIVIIIGALRFITSGSDISTNSRTDTDVEEARSTIGYALIGLIVIVLAQAIITYVIRRL